MYSRPISRRDGRQYEYALLDPYNAQFDSLLLPVETLESMAAELNATIEVLREIEMPCASPSNIEHPISTLIGQVTLPTNGKEHITAPVLVQPPVSDRPPIVTRRGSKLPKDLVRTLVGEGPRICMEIKVTSNSHEEEGSSFLDFDPF